MKNCGKAFPPNYTPGHLPNTAKHCERGNFRRNSFKTASLIFLISVWERG